jgi:hypothetical protein
VVYTLLDDLHMWVNRKLGRGPTAAAELVVADATP